MSVDYAAGRFEFPTISHCCFAVFGIETWQIADMLDTSEHTVHTCLTDSLRRTGCRDARELSARALQECDNDLYDGMRLKQEMASLQNAAQRILERSGADPRVTLPN